MWGSKDGSLFLQEVSLAYERVVHWKPNLFLPPYGSEGKKFVQELARLLQAYADNSSLECVAMKGVVLLQQLLLQKPTGAKGAKIFARHLQRRLDLWLDGDVEALLRECQCIQDRLSPSHSKRSSKSTLAQTFARKIKQGNVKGALDTLSMGI